MTNVGMPELIIFIVSLLFYVALPLAVIVAAYRLVQYGRDQARREYEANARNHLEADQDVDAASSQRHDQGVRSEP